MKHYLSPLVLNLKPSGIRKFFDLASGMEGVISLGVGNLISLPLGYDGVGHLSGTGTDHVYQQWASRTRRGVQIYGQKTRTGL